jgi:hypothetical protein
MELFSFTLNWTFTFSKVEYFPNSNETISKNGSAFLFFLLNVSINSFQLPQEYLSRLLPLHSAAPVNYSQPAERTGLGYDPVMLKHQCMCENAEIHPENPSRLRAIW